LNDVTLSDEEFSMASSAILSSLKMESQIIKELEKVCPTISGKKLYSAVRTMLDSDLIVYSEDGRISLKN
jgi:hypothetical protein